MRVDREFDRDRRSQVCDLAANCGNKTAGIIESSFHSQDSQTRGELIGAHEEVRRSWLKQSNKSDVGYDTDDFNGIVDALRETVPARAQLEVTRRKTQAL